MQWDQVELCGVKIHNVSMCMLMGEVKVLSGGEDLKDKCSLTVHLSFYIIKPAMCTIKKKKKTWLLFYECVQEKPSNLPARTGFWSLDFSAKHMLTNSWAKVSSS